MAASMFEGSMFEPQAHQPMDEPHKQPCLSNSMDGIQTNSVAKRVSRLFCFNPHVREREPSSLDLQSSMSLSISPAAYGGLVAPAIMAAMPENEQQASAETESITDSLGLSTEDKSSFTIVTEVPYTGEIPELPFDVVAKILGFCETKDLAAAHSVSRDWRHAVRLNLKQLAPSNLDAEKIAYFPMVESLYAEYQTIQGPELFNLSSMKALGLKGCTFKHPISDLASMKDLQRLKLKDISFCEPDALDACRLIPQLTELTHLEISRSSEMLHCMPNVQVKDLRNLQGLVLNDAGMGIKLANLTQISKLEKLTDLTISKSMVDFDIARSIAELTQLHRLELPDVSLLNNACLAAFSRLTNLTRLDLRTIPDGRSDLGDGISAVANMFKLEYLNLSGNSSLSFHNLDIIGGLKDLKYLSMSGLNLGDYANGAGPVFLGALANLTTLNLCGTLLKPTQFGFLKNLKLLKTLDVSHTFLDSTMCHHIADMKDLSILKMNYCPVNNEGLLIIMKGCPSLTYVRTDGCWISTVGMFSALLKRPEVIFWSKSDLADEFFPRPTWYRKMEVIVNARLQPEHMTLRSLWVKEKSWPGTIGTSAVVLLVYIVWMVCWLFMLMVLSVLPVCGAIGFGLFVSPAIFVQRVCRGAFRSSLEALPDSYNWLYTMLFPSHPRTAHDRIAELV